MTRWICLTLAVAFCAAAHAQPLSQDAGAVGAWQKIRKLQTTASVLHTTAHQTTSTVAR